MWQNPHHHPKSGKTLMLFFMSPYTNGMCVWTSEDLCISDSVSRKRGSSLQCPLAGSSIGILRPLANAETLNYRASSYLHPIQIYFCAK